jgi:hypothetical protein
MLPAPGAPPALVVIDPSPLQQSDRVFVKSPEHGGVHDPLACPADVGGEGRLRLVQRKTDQAPRGDAVKGDQSPEKLATFVALKRWKEPIHMKSGATLPWTSADSDGFAWKAPEGHASSPSRLRWAVLASTRR